MANPLAGMSRGTTSPASHAFTITPNDGADLTPSWAHALYVGGTGNLRVTTIYGDTVTFTAVPAGIFPVSVRRVHATGTTATALVGLY